MDLFNVTYEALLPMLQRFFAHTEETDAQLKALADASVEPDVPGPQAARRPGHHAPGRPGLPGPHGLPSFELFYESDTVLPHREAAWILIIERRPPGRRVLLARVPARPAVAAVGLAAVRSSLTEIARSLEAHLPARDVKPGPAGSG